MGVNPSSKVSFLERPIVRCITYCIMPLLALAAMLIQLWLSPKPIINLKSSLFQNYLNLGIYFGIVFTALVVITGVIIHLKRHHAKWLTIFLDGCALVAFVSSVISETFINIIETNLLWRLPVLLFSTICFGLLTPIIASTWQIVARPLQKGCSAISDGILTLLGMITVFFGGPLIGILLVDFVTEVRFFLLAGVVGYCIILLAGVLHLIWLISQVFFQKIAHNKHYTWILTFIVTLILPLTGLVLNLHVGFPADLQSRWSYLLTFLTAFTLLLPDGKGVFGKILAFCRWLTFPFTVYFFIIFLPFLPLALPSMLIFGAGILILAPTLLLSVHIPALTRSTARFSCRSTRIMVALLGCAILPLLFVASVERDRTYVRPLISAIANPDATAPCDELPIDDITAKRITQVLFENTRSIPSFPLLNLWKNYRLSDGLTPSAKVLNSLATRFELPYATNAQRRRGFGIRAKEVPVTLSLRGETTCELTVAIDIPAIKDAEEFSAPILLEDGVRITGLRLKMPKGGPWRDGLLCDRRAATWVYERLTERRIDPALLTLDTLTRGTLRVSPVNEARQVEIDLLLPRPDWCKTPITIGTQSAELQYGQVSSEPTQTKAATVCFIGPGAQAPLPQADLYVLATPVIVVSETAPTELPTTGNVDAERAFLFARGNAYIKNLHITEALYVGKGWNNVFFTPMTPKRCLPKLAPDEPWQQATNAAQLAEACIYAPHPEYAEPLCEAMQKSKALMPGFAYIVVENELQERSLKTLDLIAKQAMQGVDFAEPSVVKQSSPTFWCLLLLFIGVIALKELCSLKRKRLS